MVKNTAATQDRPSMTLANLGRTGAIGGASRLARATPTSSMATAPANIRSPHLPYASRRAIQRAGMSRARYAATRYAKGRSQSKARSTTRVTSRTITPLKKRTICESALRRSTRRVARRVARELPSRLLEGRSTDKHNNTARLTLTRAACYTALPFSRRARGRQGTERASGRSRRGDRLLVPEGGALHRRQLATGRRGRSGHPRRMVAGQEAFDRSLAAGVRGAARDRDRFLHVLQDPDESEQETKVSETRTKARPYAMARAAGKGVNGVLTGFSIGFLSRAALVAAGLLASGARGNLALVYVAAFFTLHAATQVIEVLFVHANSRPQGATP